MVTPTKNTSLLKFPAAPRLPSHTREYSPDMVDQLENSLRLYFNQIDNTLQALLGVRGGQYMNAPYASITKTTDQTAAAIDTAYRIAFTQSDYLNGATFSVSDGVTVAQSGLYNIQFSAQFKNTSSADHPVGVWLRTGNATTAIHDVPNTASYIYVPSKHGSLFGVNILAANFFVELSANDYVELWWSTNDLAVSLWTVPSQTSPFVAPASPAAVMTVSFVSSVIG